MVWFAAVAVRMSCRYPDRWSDNSLRHLSVLLIAWVTTALLLGVVVTRFERFPSWWIIALGTIAGSFLVMGTMLGTVERMNKPPTAPSFKSTDTMMEYFASDVTKWIKQDRGVDLDYSLESIKVIEEELERISKEVNRTHPQGGTFGLALGYGAYIGEVFRRRDGGTWAAHHPVAGSNSYPLTINGNGTMFPVGWCWKRLTQGEEDNVYYKALAVAHVGTDVAGNGSRGYSTQATQVQGGGTNAEPR